MIKGKRVLAVVPARGGSKGIKLKNLRKVGGKSLVALAGEIACQVNEIDKSVVSTDHEEIKKVAEASGLEAPFVRPLDLSGDIVGDLEVLTHALLATEQVDGQQYDIVVMLQPTSPMRTVEHVQDTIRKLVEEEWDSVWTVSPSDSKAHPLKQLQVGGDSTLSYYDSRGGEIIARQQLSTLYYRNGLAYAITRECLLEQKSTFGKKTSGLVVAGHFVSIDTEWDLKLVEYLMNEGKKATDFE